VIANDLQMDSQWQALDKQSLEQLKAGEWRVTHREAAWQPRLDVVSPNCIDNAANIELDL